MAHTFDELSDKQKQLYKMVKSQMALQYKASQEREGAPAPLTILTYPWRLLLLLAPCGGGGQSTDGQRVDGFTKLDETSSTEVTRERSITTDKKKDDQIDKQQRGIFYRMTHIYAPHVASTTRSKSHEKDDDLWLTTAPTDRWGSKWHRQCWPERPLLEEKLNEHVEQALLQESRSKATTSTFNQVCATKKLVEDSCRGGGRGGRSSMQDRASRAGGGGYGGDVEAVIRQLKTEQDQKLSQLTTNQSDMKASLDKLAESLDKLLGKAHQKLEKR